MDIRDLAPLGILLVVAAIVLGIGAEILTTLRGQYAEGDKAYDVANFSLDGMLELGSWFPTIGLVIAAGLVIGVVVASFAFRR